MNRQLKLTSLINVGKGQCQLHNDADHNAPSFLWGSWLWGEVCPPPCWQLCRPLRFMMYYLMWKVLAGLHSEAAMSFLLMGHTKFAPDWCFGLMKQYYWQTKVGDLDDIANFVSLSLTIDVPQLVRSLDGTIYCMFQHITGVNFWWQGISHLHHFHFSAADPGMVFVKESNLADECKIKLLRNTSWRTSACQLPRAVGTQWPLCRTKTVFIWKNTWICPDNICPKPWMYVRLLPIVITMIYYLAHTIYVV